MSTTTTLDQPAARTAPTDPVGVDPTRTLKALKPGQMTQTLPERLALARQRKMGHAAFLQLILDDEITRRESRSAMLRARTAGLDPAAAGLLGRAGGPDLRPGPAVRPDQPGLHRGRQQRPAPGTRRGREDAPGDRPGTHRDVHAARADKLFTRLRAARLDNTLEIDAINQTAGSGATPKGIYITQGKRVQMLYLYVHDTWRTGIGIDFVTGLIHGCWVVDNGRSNAARASGSHPGNSGIGIGLTNVEDTTEQIVISGNLAAGCSNFGIFVESQHGSLVGRGVVITGNTCRDNGRGGIADAGGHSVVITGNSCLGNEGAGVAVDYGTMGVQPTKGRPGAHTLVSGNMLEGNERGVRLETAGNWNLDSPHITGNTIPGNTEGGVVAQLDGTGAHENVWFDGNATCDSGGPAVLLTGSTTVDRLAVTDIRMWGNAGSAVERGDGHDARTGHGQRGLGQHRRDHVRHGQDPHVPCHRLHWVDGSDVLPT